MMASDKQDVTTGSCACKKITYQFAGEPATKACRHAAAFPGPAFILISDSC